MIKDIIEFRIAWKHLSNNPVLFIDMERHLFLHDYQRSTARYKIQKLWKKLTHYKGRYLC